MNSDSQSALELATKSGLAGSAGLSPTASPRGARRSALEACWPLIREAIEPRVPDLLLSTMGPMARSTQMADISVARTVLANDQLFGQAFLAALRSEYLAAIKDFVEHKSVTTDAARGSKHWSLVEYGEVEFSTTIEAGSNRIAHAVEDIYKQVWQRLANWVHEPNLSDADNPFRPAIALRALHAALRAAEVKDDEQILGVLRRFETTLSDPLAAVYGAVDAHLASKGISADPDVEAISRIATAQTGGIQRAGRFSSGASMRQLHEEMQRRLDGGLSAPPSASGADESQDAVEGRITAIDFNSPEDRADKHLLEALGELQRASRATLAALHQGVALGVDEQEAAQARAGLIQKAHRQIDKLTIEIVGLVFERVNRDAHVPKKVKALLAQLQYPLIKVALIDPELFASSEHPARRLIDRIASTSVGWTEEGEENHRYLEAASQAVKMVLMAESELVGAFAGALERFEAYLTASDTRDDDPVGRAMRALVEAENREIMVINATIKIRQAFDAVQLESYLRTFLLHVWPRVLVAAALREKSKEAMDAAAKTYLAIIPDLVWSVQPKLSSEDRKRLVGTIPPVLGTIRQGLTLIEWPSAKVQQFFARLMNSHAQAVKALELAQTSAKPVFETSTLRIKLDGVERLSAQLAADVVSPNAVCVDDGIVRQALLDHEAPVAHIAQPGDELDANSETDASVPDGEAQEQAMALLDSLKCGQWFVLLRDGAEALWQLRWMSPHRTLFLLTPATGQGNAQSLTTRALLHLFQTGTIRFVEAAPLFQRAVKDVLEQLRETDTGESTQQAEAV